MKHQPEIQVEIFPDVSDALESTISQAGGCVVIQFTFAEKRGWLNLNGICLARFRGIETFTVPLPFPQTTPSKSSTIGDLQYIHESNYSRIAEGDGGQSIEEYSKLLLAVAKLTQLPADGTFNSKQFHAMPTDSIETVMNRWSDQQDAG